MKPLSAKTRKLLENVGWHDRRDEEGIERAFATGLGTQWLSFPSAASFVRRYGGLDIAHTLKTWKEPDLDHHHMLFRNADKIAAVAQCPVVAVASSSFMGDGCLIWIDAKGRFYAVDSEGLVFLGENESDALDVILLAVEPAAPPPDIAPSVQAALYWDAGGTDV